MGEARLFHPVGQLLEDGVQPLQEAQAQLRHLVAFVPPHQALQERDRRGSSVCTHGSCLGHKKQHEG